MRAKVRCAGSVAVLGRRGRSTRSAAELTEAVTTHALLYDYGNYDRATALHACTASLPCPAMQPVIAGRSAVCAAAEQRPCEGKLSVGRGVMLVLTCRARFMERRVGVRYTKTRRFQAVWTFYVSPCQDLVEFRGPRPSSVMAVAGPPRPNATK